MTIFQHSGKRAAFFSLAALLSILFIGESNASAASSEGLRKADVTVKDTVMVTYPYSDPDPIPAPGKLYPYWRYRQFTQTAQEQSWKMVVLENEYLRVKIFPEIGGKVWSIFDKTAGKEMFYDNDVVKFRDISLRGPWTSGGIEFNFGTIGHAPTCAHPVKWKTAAKPDGSVSCYISAADLLSHSRWTIEINLPKDAVWLRTSTTWHNESPEYQPYYTWANSAVRTADDLMLIYPAENAVGHYGEHLTYPVDPQGRDIRFLKNQAYGADKSYHMVGSHKSFFGAYYTGEDWGVMHYALRDEKLGRKYFSWAQSEQGTIWVDLLTDNRPQYVEMQSGRLYNQNFLPSSKTSSYRQILFTPYGTDRWSEYWLPFEGIGPADEVNLDAVVSVEQGAGTQNSGATRMGFYPLRAQKGVLEITDAEGRTLYGEKVEFAPAKPLSVSFEGVPAKAVIRINNRESRPLWRCDNGEITRPQQRNSDFDPAGVSAKILLARDMLGMKMYDKSEEVVDSVLTLEPGNIEALSLKSSLLFRRMRYAEALSFADDALAIDQYDPEAGYAAGLAAAALGKVADAMDRFEVAAIAGSPLRTACYTELARLHYRWGNLEIAADYVEKALACNKYNTTADRIGRVLKGENIDTDGMYFLPYEMDWEDRLELAIFYYDLGLNGQAAKVLKDMPNQNILTGLWLAFLNGKPNQIAKAEKLPMDFVFPFRRQSADMLKWVLENNGHWQSEYLMAMLMDNFGDAKTAASLLKNDRTGYAPYYAYRYKFSGKTEDLRTACRLDPQQWIYVHHLGEDLLAKGENEEAVEALAPFYESHPEAIQVGDILMDAYIVLNRYEDAEKIVDKIVYLPYEGQRGSHDRYRKIKLHLAGEALRQGDCDKAERLVNEALQWPVRLGAGKPYDDLIDTSAEDELKKKIENRRAGL